MNNKEKEKLNTIIENRYSQKIKKINFDAVSLLLNSSLQGVSINFEDILLDIYNEISKSSDKTLYNILRLFHKNTEGILKSAVAYILAKCYKKGFYDEYNGNFSKAFELYEEAAENGYVKAQLELAFIYKGLWSVITESSYKGNRLPIGKNYNEVIRWYEKSSEQNSPESLHELANIYFDGDYVVQDVDLAVKLWEKSANLGYARAQKQMGNVYKKGIIVEKDIDKAIYWYTKAAEQDNSKITLEFNDIGIENRGIINVSTDYEEFKLVLLKESINDACVELGKIYYNKKEAKKAIYWYTKAAINGDKIAQGWLVEYYGSNKNFNKIKYNFWSEIEKLKRKENIVNLYTIQARKGNLGKQFWLGFMYEEGIGVDIDYQQMIYWYTKSAKQGGIDAQLKLAEIYGKESEVGLNKEMSIYWYTQAAKKNNRDAQIELATMYEIGDEVVQNDEMSIYWYTKLAKYSKKYSDNIKKILNKKDNNKLSKNNNKKVNTINKNYLNQLANNYDDVESFLEELEIFISSIKIDDVSLHILKSGLRTYFRNIKSDYEEDFSTCILSIMKILETEIKNNFVNKYIVYLEDNKYEEDFSNVDFNYEKNKNNNFKMGSLREYLGCKIRYDRELIKNQNGETAYVQIKRFNMNELKLKFLKEELFDINKFDQNDINQNIAKYMYELCEDIESLYSEKRNVSAHEAKIMSNEDAEVTIEKILLSKNKIFRFFEKIK